MKKFLILAACLSSSAFAASPLDKEFACAKSLMSAGSREFGMQVENNLVWPTTVYSPVAANGFYVLTPSSIAFAPAYGVYSQDMAMTDIYNKVTRNGKLVEFQIDDRTHQSGDNPLSKQVLKAKDLAADSSFKSYFWDRAGRELIELGDDLARESLFGDQVLLERAFRMSTLQKEVARINEILVSHRDGFPHGLTPVVIKKQEREITNILASTQKRMGEGIELIQVPGQFHARGNRISGWDGSKFVMQIYALRLIGSKDETERAVQAVEQFMLSVNAYQACYPNISREQQVRVSNIPALYKEFKKADDFSS